MGTQKCLNTVHTILAWSIWGRDANQLVFFFGNSKWNQSYFFCDYSIGIFSLFHHYRRSEDKSVIRRRFYLPPTSVVISSQEAQQNKMYMYIRCQQRMALYVPVSDSVVCTEVETCIVNAWFCFAPDGVQPSVFKMIVYLKMPHGFIDGSVSQS